MNKKCYPHDGKLFGNKRTNSWCLPQHGEPQTLSEKSQAKVHPARDPIYRKRPEEANLWSQEVYLWLLGAAAGN